MASASSGRIVRRSALALFRRWFDDQPRWLVCLDERTWLPQLVEAECLQGEPFREALDRELAWRLRLRRGQDYVISNVPRLHREVPAVVADGRSHRGTRGLEIVEFFVVELRSVHGRRCLDEDLAVQWWTVAEMLCDQTSSEWGLPPRQRELLLITDVFSDCHH